MKPSEAKELYLRWLAQAQPRLFERTLAVAKSQVRLGSLAGWVDTLVNAAVAVGGTLLAKKQADQAASLKKKQQDADLQIQLLQLNTQRAQAGLAPVDINGKVIPSASLPQVAAISNPATAIAQASQKISATLPWIFGGVATLVALYLVVRRGR
jgi:uridylate kinase